MDNDIKNSEKNAIEMVNELTQEAPNTSVASTVSFTDLNDPFGVVGMAFMPATASNSRSMVPPMVTRIVGVLLSFDEVPALFSREKVIPKVFQGVEVGSNVRVFSFFSRTDAMFIAKSRLEFISGKCSTPKHCNHFQQGIHMLHWKFNP
eukprot:gb/GEZJ01003263.1/.p1 GENE.gb/GEZJ01003263.1/~~gb/GEZJ01003263.1/.p1  ORF type:complete len:149 (+),score=10.79 gb/GEZJ01003263.1/:623-1069(+)